jgi:hypothetical protein
MMIIGVLLMCDCWHSKGVTQVQGYVRGGEKTPFDTGWILKVAGAIDRGRAREEDDPIEYEADNLAEERNHQATNEP